MAAPSLKKIADSLRKVFLDADVNGQHGYRMVVDPETGKNYFDVTYEADQDWNSVEYRITVEKKP